MRLTALARCRPTAARWLVAGCGARGAVRPAAPRPAAAASSAAASSGGGVRHAATARFRAGRGGGGPRPAPAPACGRRPARRRPASPGADRDAVRLGRQGWAVGQDTILTTSDGGAHWTAQLSGSSA